MTPDAKNRTLAQRAEEDLLDSFDEELEMELDDDRLDELLLEAPPRGRPHPAALTAVFISRNCFACNVNWFNCKTGYRHTN